MLEWQKNTMWVMNRDTLAIEQTLPLFPDLSEGWGITSRKIPD